MWTTVWTHEADDRALLRELTSAIIAAVAPAELDEFDLLIGSYFADPSPARLRARAHTAPQRIRLTSAAPAVISAVLSQLLIEIQHVAQYDQTAIVKLALRRLFGQRRPHPIEGIALRPTSNPDDPEISLVVLLYTRPVVISVPLSRITRLAYRAAYRYGLDSDQADELVPLAIARMILGASAFQDQPDE